MSERATGSPPAAPLQPPPPRGPARPLGWEDEDQRTEDNLRFKPLTRQQAQMLREREPSVSPWRVVAVQLLVGMALAAAGALFMGSAAVGGSLLYGTACVVVPGALMARGMTSRLSSASPGASAVSFMLWELLKIVVSVAMLALAPRILPSLIWPALLVGLIVGLKVYWVALLWRRGPTKTTH